MGVDGQFSVCSAISGWVANLERAHLVDRRYKTRKERILRRDIVWKKCKKTVEKFVGGQQLRSEKGFLRKLIGKNGVRGRTEALSEWKGSNCCWGAL